MITSFLAQKSYPRDCEFKEPQLSFKIAKKYFEQNLAGRENEFIFEDDFYKMTVTEDNLDIAVREDDDSESFSQNSYLAFQSGPDQRMPK